MLVHISEDDAVVYAHSELQAASTQSPDLPLEATARLGAGQKGRVPHPIGFWIVLDMRYHFHRLMRSCA